MPGRDKLTLGTKNCLECNKNITLTIRRDIERKKFCSYSCRQKYNYKTKESWQVRWKTIIPLSNTPEANLKKVHRGKNHPLYKKDRSQLKFKRTMTEMKEWRKLIFERDNYTCQHCDQKGGKLNADHIKPYCMFPELRLDLSNGRTLCVPCHKKTETYGRKTTSYAI